MVRSVSALQDDSGAIRTNKIGKCPLGALWGLPGCGYVVVPALHIPTSQEAAAAGVCGFNLPVKAPWWPCFGLPAETSYSGSKIKIGKGEKDT